MTSILGNIPSPLLGVSLSGALPPASSALFPPPPSPARLSGPVFPLFAIPTRRSRLTRCARPVHPLRNWDRKVAFKLAQPRPLGLLPSYLGLESSSVHRVTPSYLRPTAKARLSHRLTFRLFLIYCCSKGRVGGRVSCIVPCQSYSCTKKQGLGRLALSATNCTN